MQTFDQCLLKLYRDGIISYETARRRRPTPTTRPQGPRHLLDRRAVVRAKARRAFPRRAEPAARSSRDSNRGQARSARATRHAGARLVAGDLLSRRPWTTRDLAARLRRRGAPAAVAAEVVADLTARGYLDDAAFAHHWAAARAARGYGPARLRAELRQRGVGAKLIDSGATAGSITTPSSIGRGAVARRGCRRCGG